MQIANAALCSLNTEMKQKCNQWYSKTWLLVMALDVNDDNIYSQVLNFDAEMVFCSCLLSLFFWLTG